MNIVYRNQFGEVIVITCLVLTLVCEEPSHGLPHVPEEVHPTNIPVLVVSSGTAAPSGSLHVFETWR